MNHEWLLEWTERKHGISDEWSCDQKAHGPSDCIITECRLVKRGGRAGWPASPPPPPPLRVWLTASSAHSNKSVKGVYVCAFWALLNKSWHNLLMYMTGAASLHLKLTYVVCCYYVSIYLCWLPAVLLLSSLGSKGRCRRPVRLHTVRTVVVTRLHQIFHL